jgi:hypothetical protein
VADSPTSAKIPLHRIGGGREEKGKKEGKRGKKEGKKRREEREKKRERISTVHKSWRHW